MGYQELPPASWNYRGYYSGMSALKSVEDLSIKEKLGSEYPSPSISHEISEETISYGEANEIYAVPSLATADADVLDTHIQSHESQAGTPHRMS